MRNSAVDPLARDNDPKEKWHTDASTMPDTGIGSVGPGKRFA